MSVYQRTLRADGRKFVEEFSGVDYAEVLKASQEFRRDLGPAGANWVERKDGAETVIVVTYYSLD